MNEIMNVISHYNTRIIQVIFTVVLILILIYLYRLFYVSSSSSTSSGDSSVDLDEVHKKLNQLLQQKPAASAPAGASASEASSSAAPASASSASSGMVEQLQSEIAKLRTQLNESEKKVFEMGPTQATGNAAAIEASATGGNSDPSSKNKVEELTKKLEELQTRLSEYEIIAEDIAELSQLREENAELKKKLGGGGAVASTSAPAEATPQEPSIAVNEPKETPASEVTATVKPVEEAALKAVAELSVDEIEKNLMNDFEKSTQKGS